MKKVSKAPVVIVSPGDLGNMPKDYGTEKIVLEEGHSTRWVP